MTFVENITIDEAIWRNHYQIVTTDADDTKNYNPLFFGSAFKFVYRERVWLVTADHVIHPDKHGLDTQKIEGEDNEYNYEVINNINSKGEIQSLATSLYGFYFFDEYVDLLKEFTEEELRELDVTADDFFDRVDVAFSDVSRGFPCPCVTHALKLSDGKIVVNAGLPKLAYMQENVSAPDPDKLYYVYGVVHNEIRGVQLHRVNATYGQNKYIGEEKGLFKFKAAIPVYEDDWRALSGSAMLDNTGQLVGMIIRVNATTDTLTVVPMSLIMRLMDYAIEHEKGSTKEISRILSANFDAENKGKYTKSQIYDDIFNVCQIKDQCFYKLIKDMIERN